MAKQIADIGVALLAGGGLWLFEHRWPSTWGKRS